MSKYKYGFALLANARAFLESAVEFVRRGDPDEKRFAILHLVTALELLLKARVAIDDPRLLAARGKPVTEEQLDSGCFRSIGMEEAVDLLTAAGRLALSDHHLKQLSTLRSMRNRVTHFIDTADQVDARAALGAGLHLFIEIHNAEFSDDDVYRAKSMMRIAEDLREFGDFVKERLGDLSAQLKANERPKTRHLDECSNCLQDATVILGETFKCLFCDSVDTIAGYTELISDDSSVGVCPTCSRPSVARHQWRDQDPTYECICCGYFRGPELRWVDVSGPISRLKDTI